MIEIPSEVIVKHPKKPPVNSARESDIQFPSSLLFLTLNKTILENC